MRHLAALVSLSFGCSFSGPPAPDLGVDPGPDADPGADAIVAICEAGSVECTDADHLGQCRPDGSGFEQTACAFGCLGSPAPHCATFTPSNGVTVNPAAGPLDTAGRAVWVLITDTGAIFDGDTGAVIRAAGDGIDPATGIGFVLVAQTDAPSIGVFQLAELQVAPNTRIRALGTSALAIAVSGDLKIAGVIDVRGGRSACFGDQRGLQCAGSGGFAGGASDTGGAGPGGGGGGENNGGESGGGGGGHGLGGGTGGEAEGSESGAAGLPFGVAELSPLLGGGGGGGGGTEVQNNCITPPPFPGGSGGGGGGAVQLVAERIVFVDGQTCGVTAGGGGGNGGQCNAAGGGGGAGGGVLLEAASIELASGCVLAANGGGGGSSSSLGVLGAGQDGLLSTTAAAGGNTLDGTGGGDGGTNTPAVSAAGNDDEAGGGGGGAGRIRINSATGGLELDGDISPTASAGDLALE